MSVQIEIPKYRIGGLPILILKFSAEEPKEYNECTARNSQVISLHSLKLISRG